VSSGADVTIGGKTITREQAVGFDTWVPVSGVDALHELENTKRLLSQCKENLEWVTARLMGMAAAGDIKFSPPG
jgi:hypothetical protein